MPRIVARFQTPDGWRYLEWSTVVDAPITFGMPLDEFEDWYRDEYGRDGVERFRDVLLSRFDRVVQDADGNLVMASTTSEFKPRVEDLVLRNRAGDDGTELTMEQIVDFFCIRRGHGPQPKGTAHGN